MSEVKPPTGCYVALGCLGAAVFVIGLMFIALFYFGFVQRGGVYDGLRAQLAQSQLSQLVAYVELYKTQRGAYPETLEQVEEVIPANVPVGIYDASQVQFGPQGRQYHYERVGETHYILRGVGPDGVAFTADDILPDAVARGGLLLERPVEPQPSEAPAAAPPPP